jgi:hypothetical protein
VSWKTQLSAIIATSSTEAELNSAAYCAAEVALFESWRKNLDLCKCLPQSFFEEKNGAIALGNSGTLKFVPSTLI